MSSPKHLARLAALLAAAALVPAAQAATPTLTQSLAQMEAEQAADYLGRPGAHVRDAAELGRMKDYLRAHYQGVVARHHFLLSPTQVVDCVDELTQPAARRQGLTRARWVTQPGSAPVDAEAQGMDAALERHARDPGVFLRPAQAAGAELDAEGRARSCEPGTIPMIRLTLGRLAAFETLEHFRHKTGRPGTSGIGGRGGAQSPDGSTHEYAHAYQWVDNWGAESTLNIWKSYTEKASEFSLSQIWVVGGSGSGLQTVEAGAQVYRNRHLGSHPKDSHLFIYSTQDNYKKTGCYDLDCDDFVQTDSDVAIGGYFTHQSVPGGTQYVKKILVLKDHTTGDWWIKVGDIYAGYYPRSLYDAAGLRDQAAEVDFGGEIVNAWPSGRHTKTDMGSGAHPAEGFGQAAYQRTIRYVDLNYAYHTPSLTESRTSAACYDIDTGYDSGTWKTYFYFGGEGYPC